MLVATLLLGPRALANPTISGRVVAVHDGDTITVRTATSTLRVRLADIDCPEIGQPFSARAKEFTSRLVFDHVVSIETRGLDQYNRKIGRVLVNGTDVSEELVRNGLAWHYARGVGDPRLADAERVARSSRVGLWSDPAPVPPWEWRRTHRSETPGRAPTSAHPHERTGPTDVREARGPFHGNVQSHLYHRPGCPNYNCKHCEETFLTVESAEEAGYRPAGDCLKK